MCASNNEEKKNESSLEKNHQLLFCTNAINIPAPFRKQNPYCRDEERAIVDTFPSAKKHFVL